MTLSAPLPPRTTRVGPPPAGVCRTSVPAVHVSRRAALPHARRAAAAGAGGPRRAPAAHRPTGQRHAAAAARPYLHRSAATTQGPRHGLRQAGPQPRVHSCCQAAHARRGGGLVAEPGHPPAARGCPRPGRNALLPPGPHPRRHPRQPLLAGGPSWRGQPAQHAAAAALHDCDCARPPPGPQLRPLRLRVLRPADRRPARLAPLARVAQVRRTLVLLEHRAGSAGRQHSSAAAALQQRWAHPHHFSSTFLFTLVIHTCHPHLSSTLLIHADGHYDVGGVPIDRPPSPSAAATAATPAPAAATTATPTPAAATAATPVPAAGGGAMPPPASAARHPAPASLPPSVHKGTAAFRSQFPPMATGVSPLVRGSGQATATPPSQR
jgi:hypothetical protein